MRQHQDPDDLHDEDLDRYDDQDEEDPEELGTPVYQGTGLSVRALTAEELQRFLDVHADQPAELLGAGWAGLDPPAQPLGGSRTPLVAPTRAVPAEVTGSLGSPGRSALAAARRRRTEELADWIRTLAWRAPLVVAAALVGWRLRFRVSEQVTAWRRGAAGERRTARLLDQLTRDGFVVFHDLAIPGSPANVGCDDPRCGGHGEV
jgi:hypothetical protein